MKRALILVDLQNDFCPGGALAVAEGDLVVAMANRLQPHYELVVASQDWHPANHESFASMHEGAKPYDEGKLYGLPQIMWPDHCVQETPGAAFHPELDMSRVQKVIRKGQDPKTDSYSAFFDNGYRYATGLNEYLTAEAVTHVDVMGLATDYCVRYTALDANQLGFKTRVLAQACRGVNFNPGDVEKALAVLTKAGVEVVRDLPELRPEEELQEIPAGGE